MRRRVNLDMYYSNREQNQLCTCVCQHSYVNQACRSNMWQHLSCATPTSADIVKATCHIWLSILHNVMAVFSEWKNKVPTFFLLSSSSCLYFETCLFFIIHSSSLNFSTMCNISKHPSQFDAHKLNNIWVLEDFDEEMMYIRSGADKDFLHIFSSWKTWVSYWKNFNFQSLVDIEKYLEEYCWWKNYYWLMLKWKLAFLLENHNTLKQNTIFESNLSKR